MCPIMFVGVFKPLCHPNPSDLLLTAHVLMLLCTLWTLSVNINICKPNINYTDILRVTHFGMTVFGWVGGWVEFVGMPRYLFASFGNVQFNKASRVGDRPFNALCSEPACTWKLASTCLSAEILGPRKFFKTKNKRWRANLPHTVRDIN